MLEPILLLGGSGVFVTLLFYCTSCFLHDQVPFIDPDYRGENLLFYCEDPCKMYFRRYQSKDGRCPKCKKICDFPVEKVYPWMDRAPEFKKISYAEFRVRKKEEKRLAKQADEMTGVELYHEYVAAKEWYGEDKPVSIGNRQYASETEVRKHVSELQTFLWEQKRFPDRKE